MRKSTSPTPTRPAARHSGGTRPAALDGALRQAISAHQSGNLREAERRYRAVLKLAPRHPDALHYLGVLMHQSGRVEQALVLIEQALALAPDYIDARNNLGNVQKELGESARAIDSYRAVLAARPQFAPAWNNLGVVLKTVGQSEEAVDAYQRCLELMPDFADCWANLGNALRTLDDPQGAMSAYHKAIELAPQTSDAYRNLGQALVASGRTAEALDVYRRWQQREPDDPVIAHMIAAASTGSNGEGAVSAPARASDGYVQNTFDRFASSFDDVLTSLDYRAPAICGELVASATGAAQASLDVLDAGCGTGLCAPILAPYARSMVGVDLSPKMLEKAARRGGYDLLEAAELTAWLQTHGASYDLIVSADTLCYFGDIGAACLAAAHALRAGGVLVFTLEELLDPGQRNYHLNPHGRYSHSEAYARAALAAAGLQVRELRHETLRKEFAQPVGGLAIAAVLAPA